MLAQLLPPGRLRKDADSTIYKVLLGAADELVRVSQRVVDLFREHDPAQTLELLPDFENMLALEAVGADDERRNRVIAALLRRVRFRPVDFQTVLAPLLVMEAVDVPVIERSRAFAILVGDDQEVYRFFIYRDPLLPGTPDLVTAQETVTAMEPAHTLGTVIESITFLCDDPFSLTDRDLLGGTAADSFEVLTGLVPGWTWAGNAVDVTTGETLVTVGSAEQDTATTGLRTRNGFSSTAWRFADNSTDALELDDAAHFDFDDVGGPSWMFVYLFRTTGGAPAASRTIYGDRDSAGKGAEVLMNSSGHLLWTVDAAFRTLTENYGDDAWHVLVVRWRYDTDTIDMASELSTSAPVAVGGTVTSVAAARFGAGQAGRPAALGCQVAFVTSISGDQVHTANLSAVATAFYGLMINPSYEAA